LLYFALYIGYINKIQKHVPPYNISHIYLISLILSKVLKIPTNLAYLNQTLCMGSTCTCMVWSSLLIL